MVIVHSCVGLPEGRSSEIITEKSSRVLWRPTRRRETPPGNVRKNTEVFRDGSDSTTGDGRALVLAFFGLVNI